MALNCNPVVTVGSSTINVTDNVIISNTTIAFTTTIPTVPTDGVTYLSTKFPTATNSIATMTSNAANKININPSTVVTNYSVFPANNVELISYNNSYLVGKISRNISSGVISRASCTLTSNSTGNYYITCTGVGNVILAQVTMNSNAPPSSMMAGIIQLVSGVSGRIVLASDIALTNIIMNISGVNGSTSAVSTSILLQTTTIGNTYYVGWIPVSGTISNMIGVCSVRIT